jgi:Rha family phage regulatory protein
MSTPVSLPVHAVTLTGTRILTTSLVVADVFGKKHFHVLRDIDHLDCSPDFRESNFGDTFREVPGPNNAKRQERYFTLTKDGFTFLAMGYTGAQAAAFKEAYISRFNALEAELARGSRPLPITETVTVTLGKDDYIRHLEHQLGRSYRVGATPPTPPAPVVTRSRPVTDSDVVVAVKMFNAGASKGAIGRALGRSRSTVSRLLDRATRATPPAPVAQPQLDLAMDAEARS